MGSADPSQHLPEVGNRARPTAADHTEDMTTETAEPGTQPNRNPRLTKTLPPAEWGVKRNLAGFEAGEDQTGQTGASAPATRAPACRQAGRIGNGRVACLRLPVATRRQTGATCLPPRRGWQAHRQVKERLVAPLARLVSGQGIGSVGWMFLAGLLMKDTPAEISIRPYGGGRTGLRVCEEIVAGPRACLRRPGRQA